MLAILEERAFPLDRVRLLASPRQGGRSLRFRGAEVPVEAVNAEAFPGVEIALSRSRTRSRSSGRRWPARRARA